MDALNKAVPTDLPISLRGSAETPAARMHHYAPLMRKAADELDRLYAATRTQPAAVSAPSDLSKFDIDLMAQKFPLPETRYNGCGDGSEPLYTPEMVYAYAHQHIVAMAKARAPELNKALARIAELEAAARAAAPVSGQGELPMLPKPDTHCYDEDSQSDVWSHSETSLRAYGQLCIDSRPRSEDSRAKVLEEAAQACDSRAENFQTSMTNAIHGSTAELARALRNEASSCALAIRALASTPPKADNE